MCKAHTHSPQKLNSCKAFSTEIVKALSAKCPESLVNTIPRLKSYSVLCQDELLTNTPSENPKSRPKKLLKLALCIFLTSKLCRNYIITKIKKY